MLAVALLAGSGCHDSCRTFAPRERGRVPRNSGKRQVTLHAPVFGETSVTLPGFTVVINRAHRQLAVDPSGVLVPAIQLHIMPALATACTLHSGGILRPFYLIRKLMSGNSQPNGTVPPMLDISIFEDIKVGREQKAVQRMCQRMCQRVAGQVLRFLPLQVPCCVFWQHESHHIAGSGV
jgi:hypothetical protein